MGQANVDAPAADELLSQLAGDEIDRLLAEAEKESLPPPDAPKKAAESTPPPPTKNVVAPKAPSPAQPAAGGAALAPSEGINTSATTLAELFKDMPDSPPPAAAAAAPIPVVVPADIAVSQAPVSAPAPPAMASLPTPPAPSPPKSAAVAVTSPDDDPPLSEAPAREPLLIRFLEKLNSPLDNLDDAARQRIGYIALITLFNAVAVLAYVHFTHRR